MERREGAGAEWGDGKPQVQRDPSIQVSAPHCTVPSAGPPAAHRPHLPC